MYINNHFIFLVEFGINCTRNHVITYTKRLNYKKKHAPLGRTYLYSRYKVVATPLPPEGSFHPYYKARRQQSVGIEDLMSYQMIWGYFHLVMQNRTMNFLFKHVWYRCQFLIHSKSWALLSLLAVLLFCSQMFRVFYHSVIQGSGFFIC